MRYSVRKYFLGGFMLIPFCASTQNLRSMVSSYTYCYKDSTQNVTVDSNMVLLYDKAGRLLRNYNILDVCYLDFEYNKQGKLILEEEHCGEGFSIFKTKFEKNVAITEGESTYNLYFIIDSLSEKGNSIHRIEKIRSSGFNGDKDTVWNERHYYTKYDQFENILLEEEYDDDGLYYSEKKIYDKNSRLIQRERSTNHGYANYLEKWKFNSNGNLIFKTMNENHPISSEDDSIVFSYDVKGRLIEKTHFTVFRDNAKVVLIDSVIYQYLEKKVGNETRAMNDTIIRKFIGKAQTISMPQKIISIHTSKGPNPSERTEFINLITYDEEGRVTAINLSNRGRHPDPKAEKNIRVLYPKPGYTIVEVVDDPEDSETDIEYRCIYENGLLKLEQEFTAYGFMHAVSRYNYTFYK